ncbi:MAG: ChaN family lipoprotein [Nitrospira sp.]|nr:ChaN family lipoprotein [Nitrospira sp.]MCP9442643.1 ChaN family lipoprotein [Nitrospira sp.]
MAVKHLGDPTSYRGCPSFLTAVFALMVAVSLGCAQHDGLTRTSEKTSDEAIHWRPWQVLETRTGRLLSTSDWLNELTLYEVVYVGEEHYNAHHIEAALRILEHLRSNGLKPVIGMEMFGWDGQEALDDYLLNMNRSKSDFLAQVRWTQNWGGAFEEYEPLVAFARTHGLSIRAMNPPRPLIRQIVKVGLAQARKDPEWQRWGLHQEEIVDDPAYRARILDQIERCHGGGTGDHFQTMYEASMVRDEGMAMTIATSLRELRRAGQEARQIIVSYTGGGHIQYGLPVPQRVARRFSGHVKQTTVYLMSYDERKTDEIREHMRERIADYIWLTPMSKKGPPQRCR